MEVSKQFPNLKEQLLYKLEDIALHEEKRLEESASILASQVILSPEHFLHFPTKASLREGVQKKRFFGRSLPNLFTQYPPTHFWIWENER